MEKISTSFFEERTGQILQMLEDNNRITIAEVMETCGVSSSTARLQLKELDRRGLLTRTRGGAIRREGGHAATQDDIRNLGSKVNIARRARQTISQGDVIAIGGGTTALCLARELVDAREIVVITNSIYVAHALLPNRNIEVQMSGGVVRGQNGACVGPRAEELFQNISVSKSYIGVDSVSSSRGFTTINPDERTERSLLHSARDSYVLCDHTKFSVGPFTEVLADFSEVDYLISDSELSKEDERMLTGNGIAVIRA